MPAARWGGEHLGVGFFSVFSVCDAPAVSSGGRTLSFRWGPPAEPSDAAEGGEQHQLLAHLTDAAAATTSSTSAPG